MSKILLDQLDNKIQQLPSLSLVVTELLELFNKDDIDIALLMKKVGQDQALSVRVLKVVNSPFYGCSQHVGSLVEAGMLIGIHSLRNIVTAAGIIGYFPDKQNEKFNRLAFWQHAIGNGIVAKVLARSCGYDEESAFTAGLLHDIGKLVLASFFVEEFDEVLDYRDSHECLLKDAESEVLGFDHAMLGAKMADKWKLPVSIISAIRYHHSPSFEKADVLMANLIHVTDIICRGLEIGDGGDSLIPPLEIEAMNRLGLDWNDIKESLPEIERLNAFSNLMLDGLVA